MGSDICAKEFWFNVSSGVFLFIILRYAEMTKEQKNSISHRGKAIRKFVADLKQILLIQKWKYENKTQGGQHKVYKYETIFILEVYLIFHYSNMQQSILWKLPFGHKTFSMKKELLN